MTSQPSPISAPAPTEAELAPFVHLRVHTEFSVVDGITRIPALVERAAKYQQPALAITDLGNVFGLIKFYKAARQAGIKPIAGVDVWLENELDNSEPYRLLILVKNQAGYLALCELLTRAWLENQVQGRAIIKRAWLEDVAPKNGLIVLSGGRLGDVGQLLMAGKQAQAITQAQWWQAHFPDHYYLELQRNGHAEDEVYVQAAIEVAAQLQLPVVATHGVQFLEAEDFHAHEARVCIAQGEFLSNSSRTRQFTREQYFLDSATMVERFSDIPTAIQNTVEIAKRCNLTLTLGQPRLPEFPTPDGISLDDYFRQLSQEGLQVRLAQLFPDTTQRQAQQAAYDERLTRECDTIISMGFSGYFLIVADFINWAKNNGVPVGPGRGSGAGSLVAFALGITDLDPLRYDLLFERFLNPERVSMPDFDIDFCQDNRERVIDYVKHKYGREAGSQIATFGTLGAKAVLRDVGRVLELPYGLCDGLSKMIPFNPANPWSLDKALADEPSFRERYEEEEEVQALVDLARPLEGLTRNVGMHAGGVLIAPGKLTDFCPLYRQPGDDSGAVSQFDKDDVEEAGLVKFDVLGLRNLTVLDWAVRHVRAFNKDKKNFDIMDLPLNDKAVYELLSAGNTTAVFQLESRGMKDVLKKLRPNTFEDVIAMLALYRPGPLESGMVIDFVNRKHGQASVDYFHPDLEPVLASTYGVIVYQEQVMLISQIIGGYSLGGADLLRRAMGKKKPEEMAKHRELFEKGAVEKGYDARLAVKLFDLMEKFAGYGFNKSHSAAYALIAYHTAWLKAHHPAEFMAATLSSDLDDTDKVHAFWLDTCANGVTVLPPDINASVYRFVPVDDAHTKRGDPPRTIRYGLGAIKGTGHAAIQAIVEAREAPGPFTSLYDFCHRIDRHAVNRRCIEALIRAGAFDTIEMNRAALLATVPQALEAAEQAARSANQESLFADSSDEIVAGELSKVAAWDKHTRLREEKAALGFFFSDHLFNIWKDEVRQFIPTALADLSPAHDMQWFAGVLNEIRSVRTRRGRMLYAVLDDGSAQVEVAIFSELAERLRGQLKADQLVIIHGKVQEDNYSGGLRLTAEAVYDLQQAREARARCLHLTVNGGADARELYRLLNPYRAEPENDLPGLPVEISLQRTAYQCTIRLGENWRVRVPDVMLSHLAQWTGPDAVRIRY